MDREELARRLLATFAAEVEEQVHALNRDLLDLEQRPEDRDGLAAVLRVTHRLKGAARAAGVPLVEQVCHLLESSLADVRQGQRRLAEGDFATLFAVADGLGRAAILLREGRDLGESGLPHLLQALAHVPGFRGVPDLRGAPGTRNDAPRSTPPAPPPPRTRRDDQLRIEADKLDALLAAAGQLMVARARSAYRNEELASHAQALAAFDARWRKASRVLRLLVEQSSAGQQAREALRSLDEEVRRLARAGVELSASTTRDGRALATAVDRTGDLVHQLRIRPFSEAVEPLARTVRDLAKATRKEVRLELAGTDVEADRAVLDALREALLQLVRNAIDHGIEAPSVREGLGKPVAGTVRIDARLASGRMLVTVSDDGAGLDVARVRAALAAHGVTAPQDDAALGEALLAAGVSTRAEASAISGRGVGLDVVRHAMERVQGTTRVSWRAGAGTSFVLECTPRLAVVRVLLVAVGGQLLAIPTASVQRLARVRASEVRQIQGRHSLATPQGPVPLVSLARALGPPILERPASEVWSVAMLERGGRRLGVVVDELLIEQEVALRPAADAGIPGRYVGGVTVLGSGQVVPVLRSEEVIAAGLSLVGPGLTVAASDAAKSARPRVLVVDDSITTRTLEESLLEAAGFQVLTAVNGADAWRLLQERGCDLVVTDIDMPRMNGFDLCQAIRTSKRFADLPVVLVTALESPEDRRRGMDVGADAYLGKSAFDQEELLNTVRQLLP